jgi:hypothetical protein
MTVPQAIRTIFSDQSQAELSRIWQKVFDPVMAGVMGNVFINPVALDEEIQRVYGEYEGSLGDYITQKHGIEVLRAIK